MPSYDHICHSCQHEWEDFYSIKDAPPEVCPSCGEKNVQRLISGGSGRGIVELTGHELKAHLKEEGRKLKEECYRDESKLAKYHDNQLRRDAFAKDGGFRRFR